MNRKMFEIINMVYCCIKNKIEYFKLFEQVLDEFKKQEKQMDQWKNEKWLQTEIIYFLWKNQIKCRPEYNRYDIFIPKDKNDNLEYNIIIELKERFMAGINRCYLHELYNFIEKIMNDNNNSNTRFFFFLNL